MFCKHCNSIMKSVFRFGNNKSYHLYKCPQCYTEAKQKQYFFQNYKTRKINNTTTGRQHKQKIMSKYPCDGCIYSPPSSLDGKPCCMCDTNDPRLNFYVKMEEDT